MTDITHEQVRDSLPDLVNSTIERARREQIEDHLRSCTDCASELRVLQMVKDAPSFAPMIDAVKVSSRIPPYGGIPAERPRPKSRGWQLLAAAAAVIVVVATVVSRGSEIASTPSTPVSRVAVALPAPAAPSQVMTRTDSPARNAVAAPAKTHQLQVAVGLDDLSDGNLVQLASDLDALDGLPSAEPENLGVGDANIGSGGDQ